MNKKMPFVEGKLFSWVIEYFIGGVQQAFWSAFIKFYLIVGSYMCSYSSLQRPLKSSALNEYIGYV